MQKIRKFPQANLEKMVQNPVYGPFLAFSGQKSAIMGQIKLPDGKNVNNIFKISWFPIIMKKIRKFPQVNLEKIA